MSLFDNHRDILKVFSCVMTAFIGKSSLQDNGFSEGFEGKTQIE